ncbi:MAG: phage integrase N-terminal SAM-like domain-containing protein [Thermoanaerobaculales bacterium]|jgi:hypothetical protein|nr:phage integrase N-terminal SAM-like domain-containing protein [Thermoanaerobaculales bacterium]
MRRAIRVRHYSLRTEQAYLAWVRRFFAFTRRHPKELSSDEINRFLTDLVRKSCSRRHPVEGRIFPPERCSTAPCDTTDGVPR